MKNSVILNKDGIIEITVIGNQTVSSVSSMAEQARKLLEELGKKGKKQLILDDITKLGTTDIAARKAVAKAAHELPFERCVLLGDGSTLMRVATNLLLHGIGKGSKIRYFEDREKATVWLLGAD
jgi:UDP-N-acetylmuramyl pentapeptide synthase